MSSFKQNNFNKNSYCHPHNGEYSIEGEIFHSLNPFLNDDVLFYCIPLKLHSHFSQESHEPNQIDYIQKCHIIITLLSISLLTKIL